MDTTDEALQRLGKWSRWQMSYYVILSVAVMWPASWHMLTVVFIGGIPEHRCRIEDDRNISEAIPLDEETGKPSQCMMYAENGTDKQLACQHGYEYYGDVGKTIVSQWDLVCGQEYLVETSQTVMVIGVMIGAMLFTTLSDTFGRKPVFLFSEWAMVVVGVATAFCDNYYVFAALRFCAGALQQGIILTGFVLACELFPAEQRTFAGTAIQDFWAVGMCLLALFAYLVRNWIYLQLLITLPGILTISFYWFLPESIPWLIANNKKKDAEEIIHKAAKFNGITLPEHTLTSAEEKETQEPLATAENGIDAKQRMSLKDRCTSIVSRFKGRKAEEGGGAAKYTMLDVLKNRTLCTYALVMCLLWFGNNLVYYGLSLSTSALAGDRYLNFFLSGLVEIPAYTASIFVLQRFGRRWPLVIFHIIAGVALAVTLFIPHRVGEVKDKATGDIIEEGTDMLPLIITLNMIGKFGITGSFGVVFLYAPEIFPTTLRAQAMGLSSVGGRLGNMLAPFSGLVAREWPWLPGILFGSISIMVGLLALILPETLNRPLPQTVEDIENWKRTPVPSKPPTGAKCPTEDMELASNSVKA